MKQFLLRIGVILLLFSESASAQTKAVVTSPRLFLPVKQGNLWGYADTSRNILIPPQFDFANPFNGRVAVVEKGEKAFAIDTNGNILSPGFDQLIAVNDSVFTIYLNTVNDTMGGWGVVTLDGRTILQPAYDEVIRITPSVITFRKDSLWGAVNLNGKVLTSPVYDTICQRNLTFILLKKNDRFGVMLEDGRRILPDEFTRIAFPNPKIVTAYSDKPSYIKPKGWGAYDLTPKQVVPFGYDSIFSSGKYFLSLKKADSAWCYFTLNQKITAEHFKDIRTVSKCYGQLTDHQKQMGIVDSIGNYIVPVKYTMVYAGGKGTWIVKDKKALFGFYDSTGTLLREPGFTHLQPFVNAVSIYTNGGNQGLVNYHGEDIVACGDHKISVRGKNVVVLNRDSSAMYLLLDNEGRIVNKSSYDEFRVIKVNPAADLAIDTTTTSAAFWPTAPVVLDSLRWILDGASGKWQLMNTYTGEMVIPPTYDLIDPLPGYLTIVGKLEAGAAMPIDDYRTIGTYHLGIVNDSTGKLVVDTGYLAFMRDNGTAGFRGYIRALCVDGNMALVKTDGSRAEMKCSFVESVSNGYARYCVGGEWSLEKSGEIITTLEKFCTSFNLDPKGSFGNASTSDEFMGRSVILANGKWGYLDSLGNIAVPAQFDGAKKVMAKTGIVKASKKWGLLSMSNSFIIPCAYDVMSYFYADGKYYLMAQNSDLRYGYLDRHGNVVIPADLKKSSRLGNGFFGFTRTGKWGVMNSKGKVIIEEKYSEIQPFSDGKAAVRYGKKWGYIDTLGSEIVPLKYEKAGDFHNGYARVVLDHRWGYIDENGKLVIETKFIQAGDFCGVSAPVKTRDGYGLIARDGSWIIQPSWAKIIQLDSSLQGYFIIRNDLLSGLCRSDGKLILSPRYDGFRYLGEGKISYQSASKFGVMDTSGKTLTATIYDRINDFSEHYAAVNQGSDWGYINLKGKMVIQPQFIVAGKFLDHRAYVYEGRSARFIDTTGATLFSLGYGLSLQGYSEGKYLVANLDDNKQITDEYYITKDGVLLNRFTYKEGKVFSSGGARVRMATTWGLVSYTGYYLIKPRFFKLDEFDDGIARFEMPYSSGLFTINGTPVLPVEYDDISYDPALRLIRFDKGNNFGYLFTDGRSCWPIAD